MSPEQEVSVQSEICREEHISDCDLFSQSFVLTRINLRFITWGLIINIM